ncbi:MAG: hypothetical protein ACPG31_01790 [Planctomycetota bacterium]
MNRGLRLIGIAGASLTLAFVAVDLQRHAAASASIGAGSETPPPGFRQRLRGLGWTEISFQGSVEMEAEKRFPQADGSTVTKPSYKVVGRDPEPLSEGMQLVDASIQTLAASKSRFSVNSPNTWIPLVQDQARFAFDMERLWQLEDPVFEMPDFHEGRALRIETTHADLDPATDQVFGRGPFLLVSGDLRLEGADIFFDPATSRVEFQPLDGVLSWSIKSADGSTYKGSSDGPGSFAPSDDGGYRLEFHADKMVRTLFPADSAMPGTLLTRDMTLHLLPDGDGSWRPAEAHAEGPTDWRGSSLAMQGADSVVVWSEDGALSHLTVYGKVEVQPLDDSFDWASADGLARFTPKNEMLRLEKNIMAKHQRGLLSGDWAELSPTQWRAGGNVMAAGEEGIAMADLLHTDRQGNWKLSGAAEIRPKEGQIEWVRSPEILFDEKGHVYTHAGFELLATVDEQPLRASGDHLDSRLEKGRSASDPQVRRTNADGNLFVEHQGRQLRGAQLEQTGDKSFRLSEDVTSGKRVTGSASIGETPVHLDCGRMTWDGLQVTIEGEPRIDVPAESLGLAGETVTIRARRILQFAETGTWELRDDVRCSGALVGAGSRATWQMDQELQLLAEGLDETRNTRTAFLEGTLTDGRRFAARGVDIRWLHSERLAIQEKGYLSFQQPDAEQASELWGDQIELGETSGWALGEARFQADGVTGSARRIDWTRYAEGDFLVLEEDAQLGRDNMFAKGPHLEVDTRVDTITSIGTDALPATLRAEDGRTAVGEWLRYHLDSGRFESRGARFESP